MIIHRCQILSASGNPQLVLLDSEGLIIDQTLIAWTSIGRLSVGATRLRPQPIRAGLVFLGLGIPLSHLLIGPFVVLVAACAAAPFLLRWRSRFCVALADGQMIEIEGPHVAARWAADWRKRKLELQQGYTGIALPSVRL